MDIHHFPNPKINLPKEFKYPSNKIDTTCFQAVSDYLAVISRYIYTDINLDHEPMDAYHIHAWIQRTISAILIRSLYLRNSFVESFNARNMVGIFLPLKAWLETVGVLATILELLEKGASPQELFDEIGPIALGNRGKGDFRVGKIEAKGVASMMEKANKYMAKLRKESTENKDKVALDNIFTDFYDMASNPSHPSFDAYEIVGSMIKGGVWQAKKPEEIKNDIITNLPSYSGLLLAPLVINSICQKIYKLEKGHYDKLGSMKYFD